MSQQRYNVVMATQTGRGVLECVMWRGRLGAAVCLCFWKLGSSGE